MRRQTGVSPAICMNDRSDQTTGIEPDQDRGRCEECGINSVKSALRLAAEGLNAGAILGAE